jgi:hypothetical protein
MSLNVKKTSLFATALSALAFAISPAQAVPVGLELSLVIDVSGSVSTAEYDLQIDGYEAAFNTAAIQNAIAATPGGIAVNVIMFSTVATQVVGWTHLTTAAEVAAFATTMGGITRPVTIGASTGIANGVNLARGTTLNVGILNNGFEGNRLVIDVSGDGWENVFSDLDVRWARDGAKSDGITINGLPILTDIADLDLYYQTKVITPGGFIQVAATFADFTEAVTAKIRREITQVPEPATIGILGLSLAAFGAMRRRRVAA